MRLPHRERRISPRFEEPLGVILAGGRGRRIGGSKATVKLGGKPLISYPLRAMTAVLDDVVVLAKAETELPSLPGATVWIEPDPRRHPLIGLLQALGLAGGKPVLVCAADLPFVTSTLLRRLALEDPGGAPAVLASERAMIQPLLGCYQPQAAQLLSPALDELDRPLREQVRRIGPQLVEVDDAEALFNVNAPEDLLRAAAILDRRSERTGVHGRRS
jgi:molybdopterin-guanine dinucleotide biosynthesis protein A